MQEETKNPLGDQTCKTKLWAVLVGCCIAAIISSLLLIPLYYAVNYSSDSSNTTWKSKVLVLAKSIESGEEVYVVIGQIYGVGAGTDNMISLKVGGDAWNYTTGHTLEEIDEIIYRYKGRFKGK